MHPIVSPTLAWFDVHRRDLPWRGDGVSAWGVLVSEVMLQQTPVVRVEPAWLAWVERWPGPGDLATARREDVLRAWGRLGYPGRALRLQACARAVVERHDGQLPETEPELLALPGVGTYTAAAVIAFAFSRRSVVLDTNVRRVLSRVIAGRALPPDHLTVAERRAAEEVVPNDDATAARWSAAVMELGALVCTARSPSCTVCPLADRCAWQAAGCPADDASTNRRRQTWRGSDRQVRGVVMALLRETDGPVPRTRLDLAWPEAAQLERVTRALVADGLADPHDDGLMLARERPRQGD